MFYKYNDDMPSKLVEFFESFERYEIIDGEKKPLTPPTFEGFCDHANIAKSTLYEWKKTYPEFTAAMEKCKAKQAHHIIANAMEGLVSGAFPIFMMKNCHAWVDRVETENNNTTKIQIDIDDGEL